MYEYVEKSLNVTDGRMVGPTVRHTHSDLGCHAKISIERGLLSLNYVTETETETIQLAAKTLNRLEKMNINISL